VQGRPGAGWLLLIRYAKGRLRYIAQRETGQPEHPGLPCAMVGTAYVVFSPGSDALLPPSPCGWLMRAVRLDSTHHRKTWRTDPGRQDDTIWPYADHTGRARDALAHGCPPCEAFRADVIHVHRRPARVRDDRDTPSSLGRSERKIR
jgi:hypothetical protein